MRHNKLNICIWLSLVLLVSWSALSAEPSAFELQSGATKKDLKNLQSTNKNLENIAIDYSARVQTLEQSQEGLRSVVDGQALRIKILMDSLSQQDNLIKTLQGELRKQNETITQQSTLIVELQQKHNNNTKLIEQLDTKINNLAALVTKLNQDILSQLNNLSTSSKPNTQQTSQLQKQPTSSQSSKALPTNKEMLDEARKFYREGKLDKAKELYQQLVNNNYRVASSLYMLGEITYQKGEFKEAISFYKRSASLDDKAGYMPILLWHTAWAFRYSKDMTNYNKFLDSLVYLYPESEQGKKAKDLRKTKDDNEQN